MLLLIIHSSQFVRQLSIASSAKLEERLPHGEKIVRLLRAAQNQMRQRPSLPAMCGCKAAPQVHIPEARAQAGTEDVQADAEASQPASCTIELTCGGCGSSGWP